MNSDFENIKQQLNKIKKLINEDSIQNKENIQNIDNQMKEINLAVNKLNNMSKKIKGGKLKSQKAGGLKPNFLKTKKEKDKEKEKREKEKKDKAYQEYLDKYIYIDQKLIGGKKKLRKIKRKK